MPNKNTTTHKVYIDEEDYEILSELLQAKISKLEALAKYSDRLSDPEYSADKAKEYLGKAEKLQELLDRFDYVQ